MLPYNPTPIQEIRHKRLEKDGIKLLVKREDQNHVFVSGNKWWKLKYNLEEAKHQGKTTLLTFGGAFSNHIFATAAAANELGFKSIGIIRGEETLPLNDTLSFIKKTGMELHFISREDYRSKDKPNFIQALHDQFGDFYMIPEGGTNQLAVKGCAEFARQELRQVTYDYLCLPVGTGGTMAGLICEVPPEKKVLGISVLKNGDFLSAEVEKLINSFSGRSFSNWSILTSYHQGGYAKVTPDLVTFIKKMNDEHDLPLDPVYTGKLLWAILKESENGKFEKGSTVLAIHTGGLQHKNSIRSA